MIQFEWLKIKIAWDHSEEEKYEHDHWQQDKCMSVLHDGLYPSHGKSPYLSYRKSHLQ